MGKIFIYARMIDIRFEMLRLMRLTLRRAKYPIPKKNSTAIRRFWQVFEAAIDLLALSREYISLSRKAKAVPFAAGGVVPPDQRILTPYSNIIPSTSEAAQRLKETLEKLGNNVEIKGSSTS
jgi:hypothetical protein